MSSKKNLNIIGYAGDKLYPTIPGGVSSAGWTTIILSLLHIDSTGGNINYNESTNPIISNGSYVGNSSWNDNLIALKQSPSSTVTKIGLSIGGGGVADFTNINAIYTNNNNSLEGTLLQTSFQALRKHLPVIDFIDMDCEDCYNNDSFIAFCEMLIAIGFKITFCPYYPQNPNPVTGQPLTAPSFWDEVMVAIYKRYSGTVFSNPVLWWNLQCYSGGGGNIPAYWATQLQDAMIAAGIGFDPTGFIMASDAASDSPADVQTLFSSFTDKTSIGGGFIWTVDDILKGSSTMTDYVNAIKQGLS